MGAGPYRIWKNRLAGTDFGLHETPFPAPVPGGATVPGVPGLLRRMALARTADPRRELRRPQPRRTCPGSVCIAHRPANKPVIELPDLGWSFLHAVPPIGTKFALPEVLGPQSQSTDFHGVLQGELHFDRAPSRPVMRATCEWRRRSG